ncbi:LPXTG cell wall anchor domain-containing protein [Staphylococcus simiae]|uniref:LPXTG cell wall anchor domain-containing protein n=1 Tax=Staphylococcus simiae TaxID=308354 RepID=UPI001A96973B|nr:LPXTG cell wall anchor domain-containing protein [Staphylococcus simiae]MBO1198664.1 LPXTG cell wall anchor domain-containing protein [Staphylococcus simiae]MBO1200851.1 LPXTG cell wall anchor domain-containing protein [Staphylococcus simiae]MBO1203059.1 LPXTG cell wall anchor domain-containing protein [Staphylococcus simiae]MBO1211290.1 LPXTG cell wall anchor domain-containing protein [Staphylococcus simiae]MBO1229187.1 LPXTG cell wall anchor domain-containing protein [Staphylococcus simia
MKKRNVLGTTALAGVLLFTGVGHQAHAAESGVNAGNAVNIANEVSRAHGAQPEYISYDQPVDKGNYYFISYVNKSGVGVGGTRVYKDGTVESSSGMYASMDQRQFDKYGKYEFANEQSPAQSNVAPQQTDNQTVNNQLATQTTTQSPVQSTVQELPQTGEQQTTTTWMTLAASVLLAVGSLLTFKRFAKNTK